ncbi:MAG: hypothetical protein KF893_06760 [Caldilineaceae bacterium]|nr:hypothetical protein [Caldilineaceae bacterium]
MNQQRDPIQRIHLIGAAGSGKSTVARLLADRLQSPWYELDVIGYEGGWGAKRSLAQRLADIERILAQPRWITEGIFLWWPHSLFSAADVILWLDLPWYLSLPRIVTRHICADWAGNNRHPGMIKLLKFVWYCRGYYLARTPTIPTDPNQDGPVTRVTVEAFLAPYTAKVIRCRHPQAIERFLQGLPQT